MQGVEAPFSLSRRPLITSPVGVTTSPVPSAKADKKRDSPVHTIVIVLTSILITSRPSPLAPVDEQSDGPNVNSTNYWPHCEWTP